MRYFQKKNENNYWESFELLINSNTTSHTNNFMDMFRKLQFYVGCVCLCMNKRTEETKTEKERACVNIFKRSEQLGIDVKISG